MSTAHEYAETIREELEALNTVLSGPPNDYNPDADPMDDDPGAADYRYALDVLGSNYDADPADVFYAYLNETALDLAIRKDVRGADYETTVEILRTCGGPHCDITRNTHDGTAVTITVYWGGEECTRRIYLQDVAAALDEIAENATVNA